MLFADLAERGDAAHVHVLQRPRDWVIRHIHAQQLFFPGQLLLVVLRRLVDNWHWQRLDTGVATSGSATAAE